MAMTSETAKKLAASHAMNLDEFKLLVEQVLALPPDTAGPRVFDNYGADHAKVVIEAMFRLARRSVWIYANKLDTQVYSTALIKDFLSRQPDGEVHILVETSDVFTNPASALYGLGDMRSPRFEVCRPSYRTRHLAIIDQKYARVESSQDERSATVAFGDSEVVRNAVNLFTALWSHRVPLQAAA